MIRAENITKRYSGHTALSDLSVEIPTGSIYGLLGPNGAGKTTLIRIINQIILPDTGTVYIDGEKLHPNHISLIGYLPEERGLYKNMTVADQLIYLGQLRGLSKRDCISRIKDWTSRLNIDNWHKTKIEDLSKGMAQKIQFIATVLNNPRLLILDEPFSGFDPVNANLIKDEILRLNNEGTTVLFSTHRMESVEELCDHLTLINKSKSVLSGSLKETINKFKDGTWLIGTDFQLSSEAGKFELVAQSPTEEGSWNHTIKLSEGTTPRDLLNHCLSVGNVVYFTEKKPTVNEIFIKLTTTHE